MFSGVTSSARSPSHTKMMTLRAAGPPGCGAAGPPPSPSTTHDKAIKKMNLIIFMVVLVSEFEGGPRGKSCRHRRVLAEHAGDLPPAIDPAQPDLPARH